MSQIQDLKSILLAALPSRLASSFPSPFSSFFMNIAHYKYSPESYPFYQSFFSAASICQAWCFLPHLRCTFPQPVPSLSLPVIPGVRRPSMTRMQRQVIPFSPMDFRAQMCGTESFMQELVEVAKLARTFSVTTFPIMSANVSIQSRQTGREKITNSNK